MVWDNVSIDLNTWGRGHKRGMFDIAFCDNEEISLDIVSQKVSEEFFGLDFQIHEYKFLSARFLQRKILDGHKFDAIFLDIAMPDFDGLNLGMWLCENCPETYLIYVSSRNELVYRTFKTRPFSFLRKSHLEREISELVRDLCIHLQKDAQDDDYFKIELDNNEIFKFHAANILYIEVIGKNCHVISKTGENVTKCRLAAYKDILENYGFIQIHKSYLVNYEYIFQIRSNEIVMDNGKILPLSKYRVKIVKARFLELMGRDKNDDRDVVHDIYGCAADGADGYDFRNPC